MLVPFVGVTPPSGWLVANGGTIGNAASGATTLASADTEALFTILWDAWSNTYLPIQASNGGASTRGASAAEDYAANKRMPLPDLRGRVPVGLGTGSGLTARVLGVKGGEEAHSLTEAENGPHSHGHNLHTVNYGIGNGTHGWVSGAYGFGMTISSAGSGTAHNTMPPYLVMNYIIKY
jgi:microcystin-dependent protein